MYMDIFIAPCGNFERYRRFYDDGSSKDYLIKKRERIRIPSNVSYRKYLDEKREKALDYMTAQRGETKSTETSLLPEIKNVIFNAPATIVFWADGTKTVVKASDYDLFDEEKGLAMAIAKKALGNTGNYYETFKKWMPEENSFDGLAKTTETVFTDLAKKITSGLTASSLFGDTIEEVKRIEEETTEATKLEDVKEERTEK